MLSVGLVALAAGLAGAQDFPTRAIRIVTGLPGGGSDLMARVLAQGLPGELGQNVIVDNRPGGVIPVQIVAKAPPDGYTLLIFANLLWLQPFMQGSSLPYDVVRDFAPVSMVSNAPNILIVHPSVAANSVKGVDRSGQSQTGSAQLFHSRHGFVIASGAGIIQSHDGRQHRAHTLQGQRAGRDGCAGRPGANVVRYPRGGDAACEIGQVEIVGGDEPAALSGVSRIAYGGCFRLAGL